MKTSYGTAGLIKIQKISVYLVLATQDKQLSILKHVKNQMISK